MWKIGNIEIKNRVVLAPMAGYSNTTFRKIIKSMGAGLIYAEMVSDKAIIYDSKKTLDMLKMSDKERPIAQQIFGNDKDDLLKAALIIEEKMHPDIIDINMGCPVKKIVSQGSGSALLKDPNKIYEIVKNLVDNLHTPVTVKIRLGYDKINVLEVAKKIEEAGAKAITVHARTQKDFYSGNALWEYIKLVKDNLSIPVIGNGDIRSPEDALRMLKETGCDAVMIGRGVLGNPWLIRQTVDYLEKGTYEKNVPYQEKIDMMRTHLSILEKDKDEKRALLEIRSNILFYLKGMPRSKEMKNEFMKCNTKDEILNLINEYELFLKEGDYS